MARREIDRKREKLVSAADAKVWFALLQWRKQAQELLQRIEAHAAEKSRVEELGKEASRKYSSLLEEWGLRVDPTTRQPCGSCPEEPPERFLKSLLEPERSLFKDDYRLWLDRRLWKSRLHRGEQQPASSAFRLWLLLPAAPVSFFVAEQLLIEDWHDRGRDLESQAVDFCRELVALLPSVRQSLRMLGVKKTRRNEAAATLALEAMDKAAQLADGARSGGSSLLQDLARYVDDAIDPLWRCEYGSQLSGELATLVFERAFDSGDLGTDYTHGQLQAKLAQLLDGEGVPVPQHLAYAAPTWTQAYENRRSGSGPEEDLSNWWRDAQYRCSIRKTASG